MAVAQSKVEEPARVEQERTVLAWRAPVRPYRKGKMQMMTVPMVIAGLVGLVLLAAGEWMLVAVVAALAFAYYVMTTVPAGEEEYSITNRGLRVLGQLYVWGVLGRWWWEEKWGWRLLMVETPVNVGGRLVLPLGQTKPEEVEKVMIKFLLKEKPEETWLSKTAKWMQEKFPLEKV